RVAPVGSPAPRRRPRPHAGPETSTSGGDLKRHRRNASPMSRRPPGGSGTCSRARLRVEFLESRQLLNFSPAAFVPHPVPVTDGCYASHETSSPPAPEAGAAGPLDCPRTGPDALAKPGVCSLADGTAFFREHLRSGALGEVRAGATAPAADAADAATPTLRTLLVRAVSR